MSEAGYSRVTHPSAANPLYLHPEGICQSFIARLACVKRAASVRPEPGSNSQLKNLYDSLVFSKLNEYLVCLWFLISRICDSNHELFIFTLFNYQVSIATFEVACLLYYRDFSLSSNFYNFFKLFLLNFHSNLAVLSSDNFYILSSWSLSVNCFFYIF